MGKRRPKRIDRFAYHYESWMEDAPCPGSDSQRWDTDNLSGNPVRRRREALLLCRGCPVLGECADYAVRTESTDHVFAGIPLGRIGTNQSKYAELDRIRQRHKGAA